jgi:hypothetical protein
MSMVIESMGDNDLLLREIDLLDFAREKLHPTQHLPHRIDDRCQIQVACRDLMKHRSEEEEIIAIDKLDFDMIASQSLLKLHGGCDAHEASAEDQDTLGRNIFHRTWPGKVAGQSGPTNPFADSGPWDGAAREKIQNNARAAFHSACA